MFHFLRICILVMCLSFTATAQDLMYLRSQKQPMKVKVVELGLEEIKYRTWPVDTNAPVLVIDKSNVSEIRMQAGDVYTFNDKPMDNPLSYAGQATSAVKFHFFSPLCSHTALSYEKSIRPGRSYELGLGIIGLGKIYSDAVFRLNGGAFIRAGYKFISTPDFYLRGMRYSHLLKGGYIKLEMVLGDYSLDRGTRFSDHRNVIFGGFLVNFGKQWVVSDAVCFDMYWGMGFGGSNYGDPGLSSSRTIEFYHYAFVGGVSRFPLILSAGFKIGYLFNRSSASVSEDGKKFVTP